MLIKIKKYGTILFDSSQAGISVFYGLKSALSSCFSHLPKGIPLGGGIISGGAHSIIISAAKKEHIINQSPRKNDSAPEQHRWGKLILRTTGNISNRIGSPIVSWYLVAQFNQYSTTADISKILKTIISISIYLIATLCAIAVARSNMSYKYVKNHNNVVSLFNKYSQGRLHCNWKTIGLFVPCATVGNASRAAMSFWYSHEAIQYILNLIIVGIFKAENFEKVITISAFIFAAIFAISNLINNFCSKSLTIYKETKKFKPWYKQDIEQLKGIHALAGVSALLTVEVVSTELGYLKSWVYLFNKLNPAVNCSNSIFLAAVLSIFGVINELFNYMKDGVRELLIKKPEEEQRVLLDNGGIN